MKLNRIVLFLAPLMTIFSPTIYPCEFDESCDPRQAVIAIDANGLPPYAAIPTKRIDILPKYIKVTDRKANHYAYKITYLAIPGCIDGPVPGQWLKPYSGNLLTFECNSPHAATITHNTYLKILIKNQCGQDKYIATCQFEAKDLHPNRVASSQTINLGNCGLKVVNAKHLPNCKYIE